MTSSKLPRPPKALGSLGWPIHRVETKPRASLGGSKCTALQNDRRLKETLTRCQPVHLPWLAPMDAGLLSHGEWLVLDDASFAPISLSRDRSAGRRGGACLLQLCLDRQRSMLHRGRRPLPPRILSVPVLFLRLPSSSPPPSHPLF